MYNISIFRKLKDARVRAAYAFIAVPIILILFFRLIPIVNSLRLSLVKYNVINPARSTYIGLENYRELFHDRLVWLSLCNTAYYTIGSVFPGIIIGLGIASIICTPWFRGKALARVIYFIPVVLSMTVAGLIFSWLYHPSFGLLNNFLSYLGISPKAWLGDPKLALLCIIIMSVWKGLGYNITICLSGLLSIPSYFYEAAEIDGSNKFQQFLYITLPLLKPVLLFLSVLGIIGSFQVFDQIYVMTAGGPMHRTLVIVYYLWQNAFQWIKMGYASAMAWFLFGILIVLTIFQFRLYGRETEY